MALNFFDYNKAGRGVSKNEPEKKAFFRFFEIFSRKFWKFFQLNFVFVLFCIPIITIGPATAALTHVMRKFILEQPIFVFSEFMTAFKKNFKQSVFVGIVDILLAIAMFFTITYYIGEINRDSSTKNNLLFAFSTSSSVIILIMHFYIYPQIIALNLKMGAIVKNSIILAVIGLKRTLIHLLITAFFIFLIINFYPFSLMALPLVPAAWISFCNVFICYPVIQEKIINPYYESIGERNPELPEIYDDAETLFEDFGGKEEKIASKKTKTKGKVIR